MHLVLCELLPNNREYINPAKQDFTSLHRTLNPKPDIYQSVEVAIRLRPLVVRLGLFVAALRSRSAGTAVGTVGSWNICRFSRNCSRRCRDRSRRCSSETGHCRRGSGLCWRAWSWRVHWSWDGAPMTAETKATRDEQCRGCDHSCGSGRVQLVRDVARGHQRVNTPQLFLSRICLTCRAGAPGPPKVLWNMVDQPRNAPRHHQARSGCLFSHFRSFDPYRPLRCCQLPS